MSRIGKKNIPIPVGVDVSLKDGMLLVVGKRGSLSLSISSEIEVCIQEGFVGLLNNGGRDFSAKHGLYRALVSNMVEGVSSGYTQELDIVGVGYKVQLNGRGLVFSLGYSHPVEFNPPDGIEFKVEGNKVVVIGNDKQQVGSVASNLRSLRSPDPYKGKGIRYGKEKIKLKQGKSVKK